MNAVYLASRRNIGIGIYNYWRARIDGVMLAGCCLRVDVRLEHAEYSDQDTFDVQIFAWLLIDRNTGNRLTQNGVQSGGADDDDDGNVVVCAKQITYYVSRLVCGVALAVVQARIIVMNSDCTPTC